MHANYFTTLRVYIYVALLAPAQLMAATETV